MKILFYDVATPHPYTDQTRLETGLGGTESTITHIAHALAALGHTVTIAQHCRKPSANTQSNNVQYLALKSASTLQPDAVILLRNRHWLEKVTAHFPRARHFFWIHNMPSRNLYHSRSILLKSGCQIIAVSTFHQMQISKRLHGK